MQDQSGGATLTLCLAYLALFAGGLWGAPHLLLGNPWRAFLMSCTLGCGGLLLLLDCGTLRSQVAAARAGTPWPRSRLLRGLAGAASGAVLGRAFCTVAAALLLLDDGADIWHSAASDERAAGHAALAAAAAIAAVVAGAAWSIPVSAGGAAALAGAALAAAAARPAFGGGGGGGTLQDMPTAELAGYAAAATVAIFACAQAASSAAAAAEAPPPPPPPPPRSYAWGCARVCAALAAMAAFWLVVVASAIAHVRLPVNSAGAYDSGSWRSEKLGRFAWRHRARLWRAGADGARWLSDEVAARGSFTAAVHELLLRTAASWMAEGGGMGGGMGGGGAGRARPADCAALRLPREACAGGALPRRRDVRRAYHSLARREHPDRLPPSASAAARAAAVKRFREVHEAYERLLGALKRAGAADDDDGGGGGGDEGAAGGDDENGRVEL